MSETLARLNRRLLEEGTPDAPALPEGGSIMSGCVEGKGRVHIAVSAEDCKAIHSEFEVLRAARAAKLPDERSALLAMFEAYDRLRELGWSEAIYSPKDGTRFQAIEPGSTGIHRCFYEGELPTGRWWVEDHGDIWPSRPILYRLYPEDEAREKARRAEAIARFRAEEDADAERERERDDD